jgi:hypothetical protein
MKTALVVGIFLVIFNYKTNYASQIHLTEDSESKKLEEKEGTGDGDIFKPTHEWQVVRKGKFIGLKLVFKYIYYSETTTMLLLLGGSTNANLAMTF